MKVYRLAPTGLQERVDIVRERDHEVLMRANGERLGTDWNPIEVRLERTAEGDVPAVPTEFPYLKNDVLVVKPLGLGVVEQLGDRVCEALQLCSHDGEFKLINVLAVIDALDEKASTLDRFRSGRIMSIHEFAFRPERLTDATLFRIAGYERATVYLTTRFLKLTQVVGCVGPEVEQIWP